MFVVAIVILAAVAGVLKYLFLVKLMQESA